MMGPPKSTPKSLRFELRLRQRSPARIVGNIEEVPRVQVIVPEKLNDPRGIRWSPSASPG